MTNHLQQCAPCGETVERLLADDTLAEALRAQAAVAELPASPASDALKRRIHAILSQTVSAGPVTAPESAELLSFLLPPRSPDELGRLGPYRVLKVLGTGGMGVVFQAEDPRLKRLVALKAMNPSLAANASARQRFLREAEATAAIKNDHVVTIYDVGEDRGVPYLAMEFLEGVPMDVWLQGDRRPNLAQLLRIGREIAAGLAAAHERGLIHRDIKPGNIWLEKPSGRIKILDFGLARPAKEDVHLTQAGAIMGTPAYMAPEQARGEEVDHRCDLFSLGCVLYRLTAGRSPYSGNSTMAILMALATETPKPVQEENPGLPLRLAQLITKLLAKEPAERPASAKAVIAEIQAIQRETATPAPTPAPAPIPAPPPAREDKTLAEATPVPAPLPAPSPTKRLRKPLVAVALGLAGLAAAVVLGAVFFLQTPDGKVVRIESDDPDIKVAIDGGELKVTGAYKEPLTLRPGKVGLKVTKGDGFEFETDKLIVNKGDKIVLKIEVAEGKVQIVQAGKGVLDSRELPVQPGPITAAAAVPPVAAAAVRWPLAPSKAEDIKRLLDAKAGLTLRTGPASEVKVTKPEQRLPAGPATVVEVRLHGTPVPTDDDLLGVVVGFTDLESLVFHGPSSAKHEVSPAALSKLAGLVHLRQLELTNLAGRAKGATAILQSMPRLESLVLPSGRGVADEWARAVAARPSITRVICQRSGLTDAGLAALEQMPHLQSLNLVECPVTPAAVERFAAAVPGCRIAWGSSKETRTIEPRVVAVAGTDPHKQAELARWLLENQKFALAAGPGGMVIEQDGKTFIVKPGKLPDGPFRVKSLAFHPTNNRGKLEEADIPKLAAFSDLEELDLNQFATDAGLESLLPLKNLRRLHLIQGKVSPAGARTLRQFPKLEHLSCPCDVKWLQALGGMPTLRSLHFYRQPLSSEVAAVLEQFPNLTELLLSGGTGINEKTAPPLAALKSLRLVSIGVGAFPTPEVHQQLAADARQAAKILPNCEIRVQTRHGKVVFNEGKAKDLPAPMIEEPAAASAPFDAKQARAHQRAWAEHLGVPVEFITKQGMRFILIPPGEFTMGASDEDVKFLKMLTRPSKWSPAPAHTVRLTRPFYLGERELTLGEFRELLKRDPASLAERPKEEKDPARPVIRGCTFHDALEVCNRLSERAGLRPAYLVTAEAETLVPRANGYRLPTEAEWEFACRAGTTTLWYYGMSGAEAVKDEQAAMLRQLERLSQPNPFGLLHLYAGTAEWCWDRDHPDYYAECARHGVTVDPQGPQAGDKRVVRGGTSHDGAGKALAGINSAVRTNNAEGWVRLVLPVEGALPLLKEQVAPAPAGPSVVEILTSADYEWTEPKELGIPLLGASGHAVSADGLELWFTRVEAAGGLGKGDLWFCRRPSPDAPWGAPVNAGPSINGPGMETLPTLTADGLTLIFKRYIEATTLQESNRTDRDAPWSPRFSIAGDRMATGAVSADGLELYAIDSGTMYRYTRPNRRAHWAKVGVVEDLPGQPLWFAPDGRWCLVAGDDKKLTTQALWLAGRAALDRPWDALRKVDVPVSFRGMVHPYPVLAPDGLELYFARGNKLLVARRVLKARAADPDRWAAEWVLSRGGVVGVDNTAEIKAAAELPKGRFTVTYVGVMYNKGVTDADLENLRGLRGLNTLNLGGTSVTDAGLPRLKEHEALRNLCLERLHVTPAGLAHLKDLPLTRLHLGDVPLTDAALPPLLVLRGLMSLHLSGARLSETGLARLKELEGLVGLELNDTAATDDTLKHFKDLPLTRLDLVRTKVTDAGLAHLMSHKKLKTLKVQQTAVTARGLADFHAAVPGCRIEHDGGVIEPEK